MRKILLLLLLITAPYLGFSQAILDEGIQLGGNAKTTTANKVLMQEDDGILNYKEKEVFTENSAGAISGFALTNNGNGTVNIASGYSLLRATNDENGILQKYLIPAVTNLALTDNVNNFVIVQYNGGSPNMVVITDPNLITTTNNTLIYVIARYGTTVNYLYTGEQNVDSNGKLRRRFLNVEPIKRAGGAVIGSTNRTISTTAGLFYGGLTPYTTPVLGATFTNAYNNGSVWTRQTAQTQINNTQYNLNGVLTAMTNGRFRTDFVYIMVNNPSVLYTVMGTSQTNTLADARLVTMPSALPVELQRLGVLVGRLIIGTNNAAITEVSSAYDIAFNASTVINHNDTGNIQGGAVGDYQHVTTAEKTTWNNKMDQSDFNYLSKRERIISKVAINSGLSFRFFGDSYTEGFDASDRTKTSFASIIKTTLGLTNYINSGSSGVGSIYVASQNLGATPAVNKTYAASIMAGFNDIFTNGIDTRILKQIGNSYRSILANHFLTSAVAGNNGAITYSGTWTDVTSNTYGGKAVNLSGLAKTTTTAGATATYSFTGDNLVIGTKASDETVLLDSFTVTIDGINKGTFNFNNQRVFFNDEPAPLNGHEAMSVVKFNDIGSGAHTVVVTKGGNASASLVIDYFGVLGRPIDSNPIIICDIPMMNDATIAKALLEHSAVVTRDFIQQCNDVIYNEITSFQGYPVAYAQTNLFFDPFDNQVSIDETHPNDKGHQRIAESILAQLSPAYKLIESQTLALNPLLSGAIAISGGNEVVATSISRLPLPDANTLQNFGFHAFSNIQAGSTNYPLAQAGGGIRYVRSDASAFSAFEFWKENSTTDALYFRTGSGTSTFNPWKIVASTADVALKANLAGTQTFTGIHNFPTATAGTNTTQVATTAFVLANTNANAVLLTGNQTVQGIKTFDNTTNTTSLSLINGGISGGILSINNSNTLFAVTGTQSGSSGQLIRFSAATGNNSIFSADGQVGNTGNLFSGLNNGTVTFSVKKEGVVNASTYNLSALNTAPASATATGTLGEIRVTATHIYVCTATNTWVRTALTTW